MKLIKITLLILLSLETIVLSLASMYSAWLLTMPMERQINGSAALLAGIFGLIAGSMLFWRISTSFSIEEGIKKRSQ